MARSQESIQKGEDTKRLKYGEDWRTVIGQKIRDTKLAKDPETFAKMGKLGGKASPNRPFKDPKKAAAAANKRWHNS